MDAKKYLYQVTKLDTQIQNKLIEKAQWMDVALSITAGVGGDRVQSSGVKSKMAEAVDKCVDMEAEINELVDRLIDIKREVVHTIERVENPTEYNILHMRYIQKMDLQEIADRYDREYTWVTTCHGRALKSVQEILNARV